jgi:hypothetical protein
LSALAPHFYGDREIGDDGKSQKDHGSCRPRAKSKALANGRGDKATRESSKNEESLKTTSLDLPHLCSGLFVLILAKDFACYRIDEWSYRHAKQVIDS